MRINEMGSEYLRSEQLAQTRNGTEGPAAEATQPAAPANRADRVEISEAGRALSLHEGAEAELTPERTAEIRQKILDGAYESLEAVDELARRILTSGDL